jgi:hypothetical protein
MKVEGMDISPLAFAVVCVAGVIGCLATGVVHAASTGKAYGFFALDWRRQIRAMAFCLPLVLLWHTSPMPAVDYMVAILWLVAAPTILGKLLFQQDRPLGDLLIANLFFALSTLGFTLFVFSFLRG